MANTVIALKKSGTPAATPNSLEFGELAINYADGVLYYKAANGTIYPFSSGGGNAFATVNANGTLVVADTSSDVFSLTAGDYINIVGDGINDTIAISANVKLPYDAANSAFDKANSLISVSNVAPVSPSSNSLWWNSETGSLYIYYQDINSSQWVQIGGGGGSSGGGGTTLARETVYFNTASLFNNASENMNVSISKTFSLMKLTTTRSAWIRLYSDSASRTADESRSIGVDPAAGSGLLAEFVTTANVTQKVTPFILCGNLDEPVTSNVYIRVTNLSGTTGTINTSMSIMALET